LRCVHY